MVKSDEVYYLKTLVSNEKYENLPECFLYPKSVIYRIDKRTTTFRIDHHLKEQNMRQVMNLKISLMRKKVMIEEENMIMKILEKFMRNKSREMSSRELSKKKKDDEDGHS